ncbi:MAG: hypothetical protein AAGJ28_26395, partial [Pseudomonadota bacterium]
MKNTLATAVIATAFCAGFAFADTVPDLRGTWTGSYTAASPGNANNPSPRFGKAEWQLEITNQEGNAFYGTSSWRYEGRDWTSYQATGSIREDGSGLVSIVETGEDSPYTVNSVSKGRLDGDKIYVDFQGLILGTSYSTTLEKQVQSS